MKCETSPLISEEYDMLLRSMFDTCDTAGLGLLSKRDFENLCIQMDLQPHVESLKHELFEHQGRGYLTYAEFRDGLVLFIVGQGQQNQNCLDIHEEDLNNNSNSEDHFVYENSDLNDNNDLVETPKLPDKPKKYGRRSKPEKAMICMEEDNIKSTLPPSIAERPSIDETPPPTSRYLVPNYSPVSLKLTQETEVFAGDGDDDEWKKLDNAWKDYDDQNPSKNSFDAEQALRDIWQNVVGDPDTASMDKEQLCLLMQSVGLPLTEDEGQLDDLFNILQKNDEGYVMFHNFAEDMMSFIYNSGNATTSTPNQKQREENRFIDQEMESQPTDHSTPIDLINLPQDSNEKDKYPISTNTISTLSTSNSDASVFVSDTSDLCPVTETVDPSALAALNRRRRKRASKVSKSGSKGRNGKSNILPQHHPIKKRQLKNSPLSFLVNNDERYVSIETLRSHWEDAGLEDTSQILEALQIPEEETSMSIEVLTEAFDNEVNDHLSIKAIASLFKIGISYYKERMESYMHCENVSVNVTEDDDAANATSKLLDEKMMDEVRNQLNSSQEELMFCKQENSKLKSKFEDLENYKNCKLEVEVLNQQLENSTQKLKMFTEKTDKLQHEIETLKKSIGDASSSSNNKVSNLQDELVVYKTENKNLMHQLVDAQRNVNKLQIAIDMSYSALENLRKESSHQRQRAEELYDRHRLQNQKQENDLSKLMQQMRDCSSNAQF